MDLVQEYVDDIHMAGGEPPDGYEDDPFDMQICDLHERLHNLTEKLKTLDLQMTGLGI